MQKCQRDEHRDRTQIRANFHPRVSTRSEIQRQPGNRRDPRLPINSECYPGKHHRACKPLHLHTFRRVPQTSAVARIAMITANAAATQYASCIANNAFFRSDTLGQNQAASRLMTPSYSQRTAHTSPTEWGVQQHKPVCSVLDVSPSTFNSRLSTSPVKPFGWPARTMYARTYGPGAAHGAKRPRPS